MFGKFSRYNTSNEADKKYNMPFMKYFKFIDPNELRVNNLNPEYKEVRLYILFFLNFFSIKPIYLLAWCMLLHGVDYN